MSSSPFGEHLKREREMRGVSLEEISAVTRISTRFLDALENGRWEQLPGGAFNRGFIRTTAKFLGLDEESMVSEYASETGNSGDSYSNAAATAALQRDWRPLIVAIGIVVAAILIIAASVFAYHRHRLRVAVGLQSEAMAAQTPSVAASPTASPADAVGQPSSGAGGVIAPTSTAVAASPHSDTLELEIEAGKSASLRVEADGKTAFNGKIRPRETKTFEAREVFEITSRDASALAFDLNGENVQPVTTPEHPESIILTRKDLKSAPQAASPASPGSPVSPAAGDAH